MALFWTSYVQYPNQKQTKITKIRRTFVIEKFSFLKYMNVKYLISKPKSFRNLKLELKHATGGKEILI